MRPLAAVIIGTATVVNAAAAQDVPKVLRFECKGQRETSMPDMKISRADKFVDKYELQNERITHVETGGVFAENCILERDVEIRCGHSDMYPFRSGQIGVALRRRIGTIDRNTGLMRFYVVVNYYKGQKPEGEPVMTHSFKYSGYCQPFDMKRLF